MFLLGIVNTLRSVLASDDMNESDDIVLKVTLSWV